MNKNMLRRLAAVSPHFARPAQYVPVQDPANFQVECDCGYQSSLYTIIRLKLP